MAKTVNIKAILFDMDGVLIEAKEWHYQALNRALSLFGMPISRVDHLSTFDGLPTRRKLEMLTIERGLPPQLHEFINQLKQKYTMELVNTQCNPRFEHEYALSRLKRENFKVAVCSNSVRSTVDTMLRRANLDRYIDVSLSNEDVIHAKPDPEIYLKAMDFFQLAPYECLVVEDNENGVRAAEASGAHVMVVSDTREVCYSNIRERLKAN